MTLLLAIAICPIVTILIVLGGLWMVGFIDSLTATCVCGSFLRRGECTKPANHQPVADWPRPRLEDSGWVEVVYERPVQDAGRVVYDKPPRVPPLALPRGEG